jgi:hypothetical protein
MSPLLVTALVCALAALLAPFVFDVLQSRHAAL